MKAIILNHNKGIALVDDEDYNHLNKYNWSLHKSGCAQTYTKINNKWTLMKMHHFILKPTGNLEVDHIDHNDLNNQRNNLRIVTRSQNSMNKPKGKNCSSKYKGVSWDKSKNKWQVEIKANKNRYYLGRFKNEEDAARAYNKAAIELHGEYACLNEV